MSRDKAGDGATDQAQQGFHKKAIAKISAKAVQRNKQVKSNRDAVTGPV